MKLILGFFIFLIIGGITANEDLLTEEQQGAEDIIQQMDEEDQLVVVLNNLKSNQPELTNEEITKTDSPDGSLSVEQKFFFGPWGWNLWPWPLGCRLRICIGSGSYAYFPVCGYDVNLGPRNFFNICYLNSSNTCFQTNYVLNHTGVC